MHEFRRGRGVTVAATPEQGAVVARARDLVRYARQQGYRTDELIRIIEDITWDVHHAGGLERLIDTHGSSPGRPTTPSP